MGDQALLIRIAAELEAGEVPVVPKHSDKPLARKLVMRCLVCPAEIVCQDGVDWGWAKGEQASRFLDEHITHAPNMVGAQVLWVEQE